MAATIPTIEPREITAGETLQWRKSLIDYPAGDGWVLKYYFRGATGPGFNATAATDGNSYLITVASADTEGMTAGKFYWQAWVELDGVKHKVAAGQGTALAAFDPDDTAAVVDGRSQTKKILDAIDALIAGKKLGADMQSYVIGNRQLQTIPIPELIALRTHYAQLYRNEKQADRIRKGGGFGTPILTRFKNPS